MKNILSIFSIFLISFVGFAQSPIVTNVTSTKPDGGYSIGEIISITVTFSKAVNVTGIPILNLETGDTDAVVNYSSGTGTSTLTFNYTVAAGHTSADLDYVDTKSLKTLNNLGNPVYKNTDSDKSNGITVVGNYAYVADNDFGLAIIDISDPTNPGNPVYMNTNGIAYDVTVVGNYAYLAVGDFGLAIIDISDKAKPGTPVYKDTSGNAFGVKVVGDYAYVADNDFGLAIIDISDPTSPGTLDYKDTNGYAKDVAVVGNYAYVADYTSGLAIIDISNPSNPGTPVYNDTTGTALGVSVVGNYAYVAIGNSGLAIIDISDKVNPGTSPFYKDTTGTAYDVTVVGNYAYVADLNSGLAIINVSDPTSPEIPVYKGTKGYTQGVMVVGNYVYLADGDSGLAIIPFNTVLIQDAAKNDATLTLASPGAAISLAANKAIVIDTTAPTVSNVTSTKADGTYRQGEVIPITVAFSEVVNVTGITTLTLETGDTDSVVNYSSGTGSSTLTFNYTVLAGHMSTDLDYAAKNSLVNLGLIQDTALNDAALTLAVPGKTNSLGASKALVIDTTTIIDCLEGYPVIIAPQCDDGVDDSDGLSEFDTTNVLSTFLTNPSNGITQKLDNYTVSFSYKDNKGVSQTATTLPNPFNTKTQTVTLTITDPVNIGCVISKEINFKVNSLPLFERIEDTISVCSNLDPVTIGVKSSDSKVYTYTWTRNGSPFAPNIAGIDSSILIGKGGEYIVTATSSDGTNCSKSMTIDMKESSIAVVKEKDIVIKDLNAGPNNTITVLITGLGIGDYEYALDDKLGPYQDEPVFNKIRPGIHTVYIRDKNQCGVVKIKINVIGYKKFFTPNGDGIHDTWNIIGLSSTYQAKTKIYIFDRYGKLLKELDPLGLGWDGTYIGNPLPSTDYWFRVQLEDGREFKSHFSLVRPW